MLWKTSCNFFGINAERRRLWTARPAAPAVGAGGLRVLRLKFIATGFGEINEKLLWLKKPRIVKMAPDQIHLPARPCWIWLQIIIIFGKSIKNGICTPFCSARHEKPITLLTRGPSCIHVSNGFLRNFSLLPEAPKWVGHDGFAELISTKGQ